MALSFLRDRLCSIGASALIAVVALVIFVRIRPFHHAVPLAGAYLAIWFRAPLPTAGSITPANCGDLSYGVYIYGWPAEQLIMWLVGRTRRLVAGVFPVR